MLASKHGVLRQTSANCSTESDLLHSKGLRAAWQSQRQVLAGLPSPSSPSPSGQALVFTA